MNETKETIRVTSEDWNLLFIMQFRLRQEGIHADIFEFNFGFMSHMKRHPEEVEMFLA